MTKHPYADIRIPIEPDNPAIFRIEDKCIRCGQCREMCEGPIGVGAMYDLAATGDTAICIHCGQCANVCPTGAIQERPGHHAVRRAVADPDKVVVVSTSPSVRVALAEGFGGKPGDYAEGKMVAALRALGVDYVLDTTFSADLTIMEEAAELVRRVTGGAAPLPQFTSCCPAWIKFMETFYPDLLPHLSSAKSPIGMQGPTVKTYFARQKGIDPAKIVNVALTPCTAKKFEIRREEMADAADELSIPGLRDMDEVITTRELIRWIRDADFDWDALPDSPYDDLLGRGSGAGIIFGNTGGVMEAAVRTAYHLLTGENPPAALYELTPVRGFEGVREAAVEVAGTTVRLAIVHGTANARRLLDRIRAGERNYDFIEVMTCPDGCIGGGGQPKQEFDGREPARRGRVEGLYAQDARMALRLSHENPEITRVYEEFYGAPLSEKAERMLHTTYHSRADDLGGAAVPPEKAPSEKVRYRCTVCGYIAETEGALPAGFTCPVCKQGADKFVEL